MGSSAIGPRRPTESFVLPPAKGVHPMPHKKERNLAFGPSALNDLAQAFDTAWLELRAWGIEANTEQQIKCIKTKLAQRIIEYAAEGEHDVEHLKVFGLQGLPHVALIEFGCRGTERANFSELAINFLVTVELLSTSPLGHLQCLGRVRGRQDGGNNEGKVRLPSRG